MKKKFFQYTNSPLLIILLAISTLSSCKNNKELEGASYDQTISHATFTNPPASYRSFPFYSLNDSLNPEELREQIRSFAEAGMGGFYLHSRDGLLTEYLGDDWWQAIDAAVDEANKLGLEASFYDEDKWPSGYAGGSIPRMGEAFRAKSLARISKNTRLPAGAEIIKSDDHYHYIIHTAPMGNPIFNGTAWVDLMNPMVVDSFLQSTHKLYFSKYKQLQSRYTPSIFSDEPHIHARYFDRSTPHEGIYTYSSALPEKFEQLWGYPFVNKIELLFEEQANWREVRLHYYRTVALLFEENFSKKISAYCAAQGFNFTGHFLGEDGLEKVRDRIGNSMLHYRNMQVPGIDHLGLTIEGRLLTARRLSSVANQFGTPRRMSELFGITGHNMNFEDRKWLTGWHAVLGINHYVPHLTAYSLKGLRKRDYPPTFSYHQPYWSYNKIIEDYMARLAYATTIGEPRPQFLVISPLESEYAKGDDDGDFTAQQLEVLNALQNAHYDYDIGDEQIMADTALTENRQIKIGQMSYPNVILPDMLTIRASTFALLEALDEKGGNIFYTHRLPQYIDGLPAEARLKKLEQFAVKIDPKHFEEQISAYVKPPINIQGEAPEKIWTQVRYSKEGELIQLYNTSHTQAMRFTLQSESLNDRPVLWDPSSGQCFTIQLNHQEQAELHLPASSSVWITTGKLSRNALNTQPYPENKKQAVLKQLDNKWEGKRLSPNSLTLDFASYATAGNNWSEPEPVIAIMQQLTNKQYNGKLKLRYTFEVAALPSNIALSVEQAWMFNSININGKALKFDTQNFFIDHQFPVADVKEWVKAGKNIVEMELDFLAPVDTSSIQSIRYGSELESIYLLGDFAVSGNAHSVLHETHRNNTGLFIPRPAHGFGSFELAAENSQFTGDLTPEGYPFYSGGFELSQEFTLTSDVDGKDLLLRFPNTEAIVMLVELNGQAVDTLVWSPFEVNISPFVREGSNQLKVTLYNSLRNLLGPHHQQRGEMTRVGPKTFTGLGGFPDPRGDSDWYERRKKGAPAKLWTDTYFHIPFGFVEAPEIIELKEN
ncbi:type 1 glutamine amidotransferase family protein [Roseimarinus sediminis]|uniref:hypothetical protein n=1 Tax=Roseimarinus sediminis TaxID=1610899 RepID=UPI003D219316